MRPLLLVLVLGLAVAIAWWLSGATAAPAATTHLRPEVVGARAPTALEGEGSRAAARDARTAPVPEPAPRSATPAAPPGPEPPVLPPAEDGIPVEVVLADGEEPVPGALVLAILHGDVEGVDPWDARRGEWERRAWEVSRRYRTDENGRTRVVRTGMQVHLVARTETHKGYGYTYAMPDELVRIPLVPCGDLEVRVVDEAGDPVPGVPVIAGRTGARIPFPTLERWTDPAGIATFEDARAALAQDTTEGERAVALALPFEGERQVVAIDPLALPEEPIELVLPTTGELRVRLEDRGGRPWSSGGTATLGRRSGNRTRRDLEVPIDGSEVHFRHVPIGGEVELGLYGVRHMRSESFTLLAPRTPGEVRVEHVTWSAEYGQVRGRAVWPDGSPAADLTLNGTLSCNGVASGAHAVTDAAGRFVLVLGQDFVRGSRSVFLRTEADGRPATGRMDLSFVTPPGVTEVGALLLEPLPCIAAGRVLDAAGEPVREADVQFDAWTDAGEWSRQYGQRSKTRDDGVFALWGKLDATRIRLVAIVAGEVVDTLETVVGTTDLVLRRP